MESGRIKEVYEFSRFCWWKLDIECNVDQVESLENSMKPLSLIFFLCILLIPSVCFPQKTFTVDDFSDVFYGKIHFENSVSEGSSFISGKGWTAIVDKKSGNELIKVEFEDLHLTLHDGKALANIKERPYGQLSPIMYEDYNFDGIKDFAIEDGHNSCYGLPSFSIYLADGDKFTFSEEFTRLAHEYCGMFGVNAAEKKLSTMTKSGCCWHQYSEFIVKNNKPKAVSVIEEDETTLPFHTKSKETWNGKKMVKTVERKLDLKEIIPMAVLSFQIEKSNKRVVLFAPYISNLVYALVKEDGTIEFSYPENPRDGHSKFKFHTTANSRSLTFGNESAIYTIYEDTKDGKVGVKVSTGGKTFDLKGIKKTKSGILDLDPGVAKFDNVVIY